MVNLFLSPISPNTIEAAIRYSAANNIQLGFIPSRRQIDHDGGYVDTTRRFVEYVRSRSHSMLIERDHGGPNQGIHPDDGQTSFDHDLLNNFDIIHVDPFKICQDIAKAATWTRAFIEVAVTKNKHVKFEVGTEEAIFPYNVSQLMSFINMLGTTIQHVEYVVIQAGAKIEEFGNKDGFIKEEVEKLIKICHSQGLKTKEHNGDFLSLSSITQRFAIGLDAINIGPELGILETKSILQRVSEADRQRLINLFVASNKWIKWLPYTASDLEKAAYAGHYNYSHPVMKKLMQGYPDINSVLIEDITKRIHLWVETIQCAKQSF